MLEKLFYYLNGYLILELRDGQKERFINLCKNKEIELLHIFEINHTWFCKMRLKDYKNIREFVKKTSCCPRIRKKCGVPFWRKQIKKHKGCVVGVFLFFCILQQCSGRIWSIEVQGGYLHTKEQILQILHEKMKIHGGIPASYIDCFEIEKQLRLDYSEIGWISVEKKGCRLSVMLNESVMPEILTQDTGYRHIVAEKDGVVKALEVTSGIPAVKIGDIVSKGDILIFGVIPIVGDYDAFIRNQPVNAQGKVLLETQLSYETSFPLRYEQKKIMQKRQGFALFISNHKIFSYIPRYSDGKYDIISLDIVPYYFENYTAPVLIRKYQSLSYETEQVTMSEPEAEQKADLLWESFLKDLSEQNVRVIKADMSKEIRYGQCKIYGTATVCGNFISYQEIMEEEWMIENEYSGDNP